jgi:hypothetical protein
MRYMRRHSADTCLIRNSWQRGPIPGIGLDCGIAKRSPVGDVSTGIQSQPWLSERMVGFSPRRVTMQAVYPDLPIDQRLSLLTYWQLTIGEQHHLRCDALPLRLPTRIAPCPPDHAVTRLDEMLDTMSEPLGTNQCKCPDIRMRQYAPEPSRRGE